MAIAWYALAIVASALGSLHAAADEPLRGRATVIDGDTLLIRGKVIGLRGIIAPRPTQTCQGARGRKYTCGQAATEALVVRIGSASLVCTVGEDDAYGRALSTCKRDGEDLGAWLVSEGYAMADSTASNQYAPDQKQAWAKRRGLWAGVFEDPRTYERSAYSAASQVVDADPTLPDTKPTSPAPSSKKR